VRRPGDGGSDEVVAARETRRRAVERTRRGLAWRAWGAFHRHLTGRRFTRRTKDNYLGRGRRMLGRARLVTRLGPALQGRGFCSGGQLVTTSRPADNVTLIKLDDGKMNAFSHEMIAQFLSKFCAVVPRTPTCTRPRAPTPSSAPALHHRTPSRARRCARRGRAVGGCSRGHRQQQVLQRWVRPERHGQGPEPRGGRPAPRRAQDDHACAGPARRPCHSPALSPRPSAALCAHATARPRPRPPRQA